MHPFCCIVYSTGATLPLDKVSLQMVTESCETISSGYAGTDDIIAGSDASGESVIEENHMV